MGGRPVQLRRFFKQKRTIGLFDGIEGIASSKGKRPCSSSDPAGLPPNGLSKTNFSVDTRISRGSLHVHRNGAIIASE